MSMKSTIGLVSIMAQMAMMGGGMPSHLNRTYIPPSKPIPFTFKKFRRKEGDELPKGCKCERVKLEFIKPSSPVKYKITVEVDIIYGTEKSAKKKFLQYQNEIAYFIYHTEIRLIEKHKEDILIEEVIEELKTEIDTNTNV